MSNNQKRRQDKSVRELRLLTKAARKAGHLICSGSNGGGWINLAKACGAEIATREQAKAFLRDKFKVGAFAFSGFVVAPQVKRSAPSSDVTTDAFLLTYEWRKLRMEALKKHSARCQCCGASPKEGAVMNVDHIKPRKLFPALALELSNLQILCAACNHGKGNWDQTDWR